MEIEEHFNEIISDIDSNKIFKIYNINDRMSIPYNFSCREYKELIKKKYTNLYENKCNSYGMVKKILDISNITIDVSPSNKNYNIAYFTITMLLGIINDGETVVAKFKNISHDMINTEIGDNIFGIIKISSYKSYSDNFTIKNINNITQLYYKNELIVPGDELIIKVDKHLSSIGIEQLIFTGFIINKKK